MLEQLGIALLLLVAAVGIIVVLVVLGSLAELLRAVARHRDAQANTILHHAGLLDIARESED